jgi:DNA-binding CsgD family transcriptional regulator
MSNKQGRLVGAIYEAGAMPERWPSLLREIAQANGAKGGILMCAKNDLNLRTCSAEIEETVIAFEREGWAENNNRIGRLIECQPYPGFLADASLNSAEELETLPMYVDFLTPRGMAAGSATMIQGAAGDGLIVTIEGFESHPHSITAKPILDSIRPHLARAAVLSGQLSLKRAHAAVGALAAMGTAAAMLDHNGRVIATNKLFEAQLGTHLYDRRDRLRAVHLPSDAQLSVSLEAMIKTKAGRSLAIRDAAGLSPIALHLIPIAGDARDIFEMSSGMAILASAEDSRLPSADLLQSLFDLTPAEALVARAIGGSRSTHEIAEEQGVSIETVRTHLKRAMSKTGKSRQTEFAMLVKSQSAPTSD